LPRSLDFDARGKVKLVRAEGLEPSRTLRSNGFSYPATAFAAAHRFRSGVWGLDYPFTVPEFGSGVRCCPSSLYTFPTVFGPGLARDRHVTGFPDFEQFCIAGFPASTQVYA
jgi:hypothetical protein